MRQVHNYLHIPKTGGTAMKYAQKEHNSADKSQPKFNLPSGGHSQRLHNMKNACFIIRHPWERFCSGFWERITMPERRELSKTEYKDIEGFGYKDYTPLEKEIFSKCKTPDEYLTYVREGGKTEGAQPGLFELTASMTTWLGNLQNFQKAEHNIRLVFHINNLDQVMKEIYDVQLPQDPFRKRSRQLFSRPQTYSISPANRVWFEKEFRRQDYELIAYIKTRPYYYV
jgi:hypothetical protein